jgi:Predicted permease, DMT superfamily
MYRKLQGVVILTTAMMFLGSSFVAGKSIVTAVPISIALAVRLLLSSAILVPVLILREHRVPSLRGANWGLLCLEAGVGVIAFNVLLFLAYAYLSVASVGIVFSMLPIAVAVMSALLLGERPCGMASTAIVLSACGIAQINQSGEIFAWPSATVAIGILLGLGAVICEGLFTIIGKSLARDLSSLAIAAHVSVISLVLVLPVAAIDLRGFDPASLSAFDWAALFWWALASGVGYFWLWFAGVSRVEAHAAGVVTVVLPLSTLLLSALVLNERITGPQLVGTGCAVAAVLIIAGPPFADVRRELSVNERRAN